MIEASKNSTEPSDCKTCVANCTRKGNPEPIYGCDSWQRNYLADIAELETKLATVTRERDLYHVAFDNAILIDRNCCPEELSQPCAEQASCLKCWELSLIGRAKKIMEGKS